MHLVLLVQDVWQGGLSPIQICALSRLHCHIHKYNQLQPAEMSGAQARQGLTLKIHDAWIYAHYHLLEHETRINK